MLRETDPQTTLWELLGPEEAKRLPAELARVDAYLDHECFIAPWRALFDRRLGRPSVPVDALLRLLYLKHRYGLLWGQGAALVRLDPGAACGVGCAWLGPLAVGTPPHR